MSIVVKFNQVQVQCQATYLLNGTEETELKYIDDMKIKMFFLVSSLN